MSTTYRIKDIAERSGFTAGTLRYYEQIGLLPDSVRTASGYRTYDDETLARLAFIARAKQLGCTLDEITDLTAAWEGGQCGPVQDRLRNVVADKLSTAQRQIVELMTLTSELQRAAATLELHRPSGPCDDRCGCVVDAGGDDASTAPIRQAVTLGRRSDAASAAPPVACTLPPASMPGRLDDWRRVLEHVQAREAISGGVRVTLDPSTPLGELVRLVAAEQDCCRFFNFAITIDDRGLALEVRAPDEAMPIVHSMFGVPR